MIELIPAIDIIGGQCVRLTKGDYDQKTVYRDSPAEVAKEFEQIGFKRLHVVDLDGAKSKHIVNSEVLRRVTTDTQLVVDFGGGIKTDDDTPHSVKSYSFTTHDDGSYTNRAPKEWRIEGSDDNSTWTTIDEVTGGDPIDNLNYKTFEFKPSNVSDAFKYIRLTLTSMKGNGYQQIGEFHVVGACQNHTWVNTTYVAPTCVADGGGEQQCSVCGVTRLTGVEPATGNHTYDANGICTVCNQPNPNFMALNNGFYEPTTVAQFNWLKAMIQGGATVNIRLTQDVDLAGFAGFGNGEEANDHIVPFSGEFDGGGHWLKNLYINVVKKNTGLFGMTNGANIHDLGFDKAYVKVNGTQNVGIIVGNAKNTTFNRVAIMNGSKVEGYDHVGAFVGNTEGTCVISNCITDAEVYSTVYRQDR